MNKLRISLTILITLMFISPAAGSVTVSTVSQLMQALENAGSGGDPEIVIQDGVYTLPNMLWIGGDGITVRSESGQRDGVIIQGQGMTGDITHVFNVDGNCFTARDMTLRSVSQHAVQLQIDVDHVTLLNLRILDTGEQMIKVAYDSAHPELRSDYGRVENCRLEYSAGIGPQYYIGGVDAHNAGNWIVRNNIFSGIRSPSQDPAEFAIHFWSESSDTLVEKNWIINCDRGIGFGLGDRGHTGGIIRNNMIYHSYSQDAADVGIALESASGTQVYNNTIFQEHDYPNAIEYRFAETTGVSIVNNLSNKAIIRRDSASGETSSNVINAGSDWFIDAANADLHLAASIPSVVDQGIVVAGLTDDFDGDIRPSGSGMDIGADEYGATVAKVGEYPGFIQVSIAADEMVELMINSTNNHGDTPLYEWLLFTAISGGHQLPVYLFSDIGIHDLNEVLSDMYPYTFTFETDDLTTFIILSMSDLGLAAGDNFCYAYAYQNQTGVIIIDNIVFMTAQ